MAQDPDDQAENKKRPIGRILAILLAAVVLVALGAGGALLFVTLTRPPEDNPLAIVIEKRAPEKEAAAKGGDHGAHGDKTAAPGGKPVPSKEQFQTTYFEFPGNFTTNLRGSKRFVQVSIGLATQYDKKVIENVQKHEVAVRAEVLTVLADQAEADVVGVENRRRLQNLIKDAVNHALTERTEFGGIESVHITALVMQ